MEKDGRGLDDDRMGTREGLQQVAQTARRHQHQLEVVLFPQHPHQGISHLSENRLNFI